MTSLVYFGYLFVCTIEFLAYLGLAYPGQGTRLGRLADHRFWRHFYLPLREAATKRLEKQNFDYPIELKLRHPFTSERHFMQLRRVSSSSNT